MPPNRVNEYATITKACNDAVAVLSVKERLFTMYSASMAFSP